MYLDPEEFKRTWVGNKPIYRTRMAIVEGEELIVIAPGVEGFGKHNDLKRNLSAAAHLIHGFSAFWGI